MSDVYMLQGDSTAQALRRLRANDENKELQSLLLKNPYLLPSEQIDPENPPQWLLVKREMPVVDPATGSARWSIDFLYVDHMGIPTLVECKRCDDTRTRREVIAQIVGADLGLSQFHPVCRRGSEPGRSGGMRHQR